MSERQGVVSAFVKKVDASQGRIQVEYRSIDDQLESTWAPIASPLSGKGRGALFMPVPGDEVLIAFGDGKFDTPFCVGCLWNGEQVSPEKSEDNRVIVTPGNNQLRFEDKQGDRRIVIQSDGGRRITLDDKAGQTRIEIESSEHTVTLDDEGGSSSITLSAGKMGLVSVKLDPNASSVTVTAGAGKVALDSSGLTVETAGTVNITCSSATVTAATTTLDTAMLSVTGAFASFTGVLQCSTLITNAVVSPVYTPGIGNLL
jgi:uncharacterized protein involved in type VI secretion and phage assembly